MITEQPMREQPVSRSVMTSVHRQSYTKLTSFRDLTFILHIRGGNRNQTCVYFKQCLKFSAGLLEVPLHINVYKSHCRMDCTVHCTVNHIVNNQGIVFPLSLNPWSSNPLILVISQSSVRTNGMLVSIALSLHIDKVMLSSAHH